jgi:hypothetical protein
MRIVTNEKLIRRNSRLGQIASVAGLLVLGGGFFISLRYPQLILAAWGALLAGFILSQLGLFYGNRWGRRPRPDEHLDQALKGMDDRYTIYHYSSPSSHLLIGPAGIWALFPYHQTGKIIYEKGRWKQKGGGFLQGYLRLFAQEGLGRPDLEIPAEIEAIKKFFKNRIAEVELPDPKAALVFTSDKAILEADDAPLPTLSADKLNEMIRKSAKERSLAPEKVQLIQNALE